MKTLFHELGHVVHALLAQSAHSRLSWAWPMVPWPGGVENDFLEVPSMMMEQWAYDPAVLARVSSHWTTGEPLPQAMVESLIASKHLLDSVIYC